MVRDLLGMVDSSALPEAASGESVVAKMASVGEIGRLGGLSFEEDSFGVTLLRTTCKRRIFLPFSGSSSNGEHLNESGVKVCAFEEAWVSKRSPRRADTCDVPSPLEVTVRVPIVYRQRDIQTSTQLVLCLQIHGRYTHRFPSTIGWLAERCGPCCRRGSLSLAAESETNQVPKERFSIAEEQWHRYN